MTTIRKTKGLYECRCMIQYKYVLIGMYKTKEEAIYAYNEYIMKNGLNRKKLSCMICFPPIRIIILNMVNHV